MGKMFTLASTHLAASGSSGGGNYTFLIIIVALFAVFYFVMIRPQRNRQRKVQQMQNQVGPGSRIRTTAGMYATVRAVEGDDVVLELSPGVEARFMRRAIMDVVSDGDAPATAATDTLDEDPPDDDADTDTADADAGTAETADAGRAAKPGAEGGQTAG